MSTNYLRLLSSLHHQVLPMPNRTKALFATGHMKELVQIMFYITCNWLLHFHNLLFLLQFSTIIAQFANFASKAKVLQDSHPHLSPRAILVWQDATCIATKSLETTVLWSIKIHLNLRISVIVWKSWGLLWVVLEYGVLGAYSDSIIFKSCPEDRPGGQNELWRQ